MNGAHDADQKQGIPPVIYPTDAEEARSCVKSDQVAGALPWRFRVAAAFRRLLCRFGAHEHQLPTTELLKVDGLVVGDRQHWSCPRCDGNHLVVHWFRTLEDRQAWEAQQARRP
jgi:hypothetical protein